MKAMGLFREKIRFVIAIDLIEFLKQKKQRFLLTCAPISELPSTITRITRQMTEIAPYVRSPISELPSTISTVDCIAEYAFMHTT